MTLLTGHRMGPPMCGTGNGRDGDKLLCNRCPLKHEAQEREGGEMLYENVSNWSSAVGKPAWRNTTDISSTWCICGMDSAIQNRVYNNPDPRYGCSHPTVSHVQNDNNPQSQPGLQQTQSRVLRSISTQIKYKFKHANMWAEVEHARTSSDYQPIMKAVNRRERNHQ